MQTASQKIVRGVMWTIPVAVYFAFALPAFASYISPSGPVYTGASYSVNEEITNSSSAPITVHNDWAYSVNGSALNWNWCSKDTTIPAKSTVTVSCGSTGDVAGTVMKFQVNTWWNPWTVTWSNTGFTVQPRPVTVSASLSPTGDIYPSTALALSGTVSGSNYSGTNCWAYSINDGARSCWLSPGSGTGNFSHNWNAGSADPNAQYTFYLCTDNGAGACATAGSLRVVNPPPPSFDYSISQQTSLPTLVQGNTSTVYLTTTLATGATQSVTLSLDGLPNGVTYTISPSATQDPSATYEVTFTATGSATIGTFPITVTGTPLNKTLSLNLTVAAPTVSASLSPSPNPGTIIPGQQISFVTSVTGTATGAVTYGTPACGTPVQNGSLLDTNGAGGFTCSFSTTGDKTVSIVVTRQGVSSTAVKVVTVSAKPNTLIVQSSLDGQPIPGVSMSLYDGTFNGTYVTEATLPPKTASITNTIEAPKKFNGNSFISWSGCDSVARTWSCNVTVANGSTKTVSANYGTTAYRASLTNITLSGGQLEGDRYKSDLSKFVDNRVSNGVWFVATIGNSGSLDVGNVWVDYQISASANGSDYTTLGPCSSAAPPCYYGGETVNRIESLPRGTSQKVYAKLNLPVSAYYIRAYADVPNADSPAGVIPETNESDNYTGGNKATVTTTPAPAGVFCLADFKNFTLVDNEDLSTRASVTVSECPDPYYSEMQIDGGSFIQLTIGILTKQVLDIWPGWSFNGWRIWNYNPMTDQKGVDRDTGFDGAAQKVKFANTSCQSGTTNNSPRGDGIGFGRIDVPPGGYSNSFPYHSYVDCLQDKGDGNGPPRGYDHIVSSGLNWGLYNYYISDGFYGTYWCTVHVNTAFDPATKTFKVPEQFRDDPIGFTLQPHVDTCFGKSNWNDGYYHGECGASSPTASQPLACPGYTATVSTKITNDLPPSTPIPRLLTLNVKSTLGGVSAPDDTITQVGSAVAVNSAGTPLSPTVAVVPLEGGNFGGITDYTRTADRSYRVTLRAADPHSTRSGVFMNWGGCDNYIGGPDCTITLKYDSNGGQTKTVTANYSGVLAAPIITTSAASCDANGGKVQVYLQSAVSGATGYRLYRSTSSGFTAGGSAQAAVALSSANLIKTFTSANAPVAGTPNAPFVDSGLTAGVNYYYKMEAYNSSGTSQASPEASRAASLPCPDLIVESITLPNSPGYPTGTVLSGSGPWTFSAVIKNQGGGTGTSFDNRFLIGGTQHGFVKRITGGLAQNLTQTITSDDWTADVVSANTTRTIEVCADQPLPGVITEAFSGNTAPENNNCASANTNIAIANRTITIIPPPITVELECARAGGVWDKNYCIVDYGQESQLRWKTGNNPTSCKWVASDAIGNTTPQSYTVTGNPFSLANLFNKLRFSYQLECTR